MNRAFIVSFADFEYTRRDSVASKDYTYTFPLSRSSEKFPSNRTEKSLLIDLFERYEYWVSISLGVVMVRIKAAIMPSESDRNNI